MHKTKKHSDDTKNRYRLVAKEFDSFANNKNL